MYARFIAREDDYDRYERESLGGTLRITVQNTEEREEIPAGRRKGFKRTRPRFTLRASSDAESVKVICTLDHPRFTLGDS